MNDRTLKDIMRDHRLNAAEGQGAWGGGLCDYDGDVYPCDVRRVIRARIGDLREAEAAVPGVSGERPTDALECPVCGGFGYIVNVTDVVEKARNAGYEPRALLPGASGESELRAALERAYANEPVETWETIDAVLQEHGWRAALAASPEPGLPAEPPEPCTSCDESHDIDWHDHHWHSWANDATTYIGPAHAAKPAATASTGLGELRCGCGHAKASHFPACLANVEDKPWQDFAAPFDIEKMRWGHNYVCGCPAFGSPAGTALGKRREQNRVRRELAADGGRE